LDFDGRFCGHLKTSVSEYGPLCQKGPSFFVDAGNCFEVARFAIGHGHDAAESAKASLESMLYEIDEEHVSELGMWRTLKELKWVPTDIATRALKATEFNGSGLFGTPFHEIVAQSDPNALVEAMRVLSSVADAQDRLLGITEPAWTEALVLGPKGVIIRTHQPQAPQPTNAKVRRAA
jgi:hypothetical protein